jgi:hypothetical protein
MPPNKAFRNITGMMHWAAMPSVLKSDQKSIHSFHPHSIYNSVSLMWRNISRRALSLIFVLFSVTFLTFIVSYFAPGDPVLNMMGGRHDPRKTKAAIKIEVETSKISGEIKE